MSRSIRAGGCACGAVRYQLNSLPFDAGYCHCSMCRRASGAPVLAFASVPLDDFVVTSGQPRRRRSSSDGERWFCGECGTQLAMRVDEQPDIIDFTLASLDSPDLVAPEFHIFHANRIAWFETADRFPRHRGFRAATPVARARKGPMTY